MSDRSRSRSPDRNCDNDCGHSPPHKDENHATGDDHNLQQQNGVSGGGGEEADGVKLYVGNLDYATNDERLREIFGEFGAVTDVFLPMERGTNRPRGFGFVTLDSRAAAEQAISKMDQSQLDGRMIRVNESKPRGQGPADTVRGFGPGGRSGFNMAGQKEVKLYVGNLSFDTSEDAVRNLFSRYGHVTDCFLPTDRDTNKVRGFAFVTMPAAEAETACHKLDGEELDGRPLRVNEAQPKGMSSGPGGPRGGGYHDGPGYGGAGRGGYSDGGGYGGYNNSRGGGYDDRGGYGSGRGGYDDRGGYGGGSGYGGGGYGGGGRGGYDDRGGYGQGGGGYGGGGGYNDGYGSGYGYDDRGGHGGGYDRQY